MPVPRAPTPSMPSARLLAAWGGGRVRDLWTGELHSEPGELIQTCVNDAAGPLALALQAPRRSLDVHNCRTCHPL